MSFFLVYNFIALELLAVIVSLGYVCFHFGYKMLSTYHGVRTTISRRVQQRKKIAMKLQKAQLLYAKKKNAPFELKPKKKNKLTAGDTQALEKILKKVLAKNIVKEFEEARAAIIEGLIIDKHNYELNVLLAQYYERKGDLEKAEIIYKDLILFHDPQFAHPYIYLADNLIGQSKSRLGFDVYKQALARDEENIDVLFSLAQLAYELLDYEGSMRYAQDIVKKQSKNISALEILAQAYMQLEQYQKAYEIFLQIRRLDPYNETVQKWVARLEEKIGIHPDMKHGLK